MTVENQTIKKRVNADNTTNPISFVFHVEQEADLSVYKILLATGVPTLLTGGGVDYTAAIDADNEGGTVTPTAGIPSTYDILIINEADIIQPQDFPTEGSFNETSVEQGLDRACVINLIQQEQVNRCLKLKKEDVLNTTSYAGLFLKAEATADRLSRVLVWNSAGTEIEAGPTTTNLETLAAIAADISAVAAITADISAVADIDSDVTTVATNIASVNTCATNIAAIITVAGVFGDGDKGDLTISSSGTVWTIDNNVVTYAKMQDVSATSRILGRKTSGSGDPEECTLSEVLDFIGSAAQGDILYRGASGWARLGAGTNGYFLKTQGAAANPTWAAATSTVHSFSASTTNTTTIPDSGVFTKIPFATEHWDTGGWYDNATNYRFTPQTAGKYAVKAQWSCASTTDGQYIAIHVYKNGSLYKSSNQQSGSTGQQYVQISVDVDMNGSTDYIEIFASTNNTRALNGVAADNWFQAHYIGA